MSEPVFVRPFELMKPAMVVLIDNKDLFAVYDRAHFILEHEAPGLWARLCRSPSISPDQLESCRRFGRRIRPIQHESYRRALYNYCVRNNTPTYEYEDVNPDVTDEQLEDWRKLGKLTAARL